MVSKIWKLENTDDVIFSAEESYSFLHTLMSFAFRTVMWGHQRAVCVTTIFWPKKSFMEKTQKPSNILDVQTISMQ